jgi:hypothetical protein
VLYMVHCYKDEETGDRSQGTYRTFGDCRSIDTNYYVILFPYSGLVGTSIGTNCSATCRCVVSLEQTVLSRSGV